MTDSMSDLLRQWADKGSHVEVFGRRIFVVDTGAPDRESQAETLVILHGFPSSSHDYRHVLAALSARFRVILHDHIGFGLSEKPVADYSYSLMEQADAALGLWRALGVGSAHVLAHDYGTSVATELVARRARGLLDFGLRSLTLCNGSVHLELAKLTLIQKLLKGDRIGPLVARFSSRRIFERRLRGTLARPDGISDEELALMWEGIQHDDGRLRIPAISKYLDERMRFWHRWIGGLTQLDVPTHVLWGRRDSIAVPAIAEQLAAEIPGAELTWMETLGHYPMLEGPEEFSQKALKFFD